MLCTQYIGGLLQLRESILEDFFYSNSKKKSQFYEQSGLVEKEFVTHLFLKISFSPLVHRFSPMDRSSPQTKVSQPFSNEVITNQREANKKTECHKTRKQATLKICKHF